MKRLFYFFLLLFSTLTIKAATITVTSGADAGAGTLRAAITSAAAGDTIVFSGVTTVTLTSARLTISRNLTINGGTGVTITRSGATEFRIFYILGATTTVVFNKLSITNGKNASEAGGIMNDGNLTLNDCTLANNQAGQGGGLQNNNTMTMNRCFVHSNTMTGGGGGCGLIIYSNNTTTLNNCVFTNNQLGYAIDIQATGTLTLTNCTIAKNTGGINVGNRNAVVTLKNTIVAENTTGANPNILNNNVSASSAYNFIGTEGGNGGLTNGTNNNKVGVSPQFANSSDPDGADNIFGTADDGLMLTACNFATNAGNNADAPTGTDIAGNPRIFGTTVDIGAYEFQAASSSNLPSITVGTIATIEEGAMSFTIPYTAPLNSPTTYSISGTGITTVTDATLPSSPITVNLSPAASSNLTFTLIVKNASACAYTFIGNVIVSSNRTWTGAVSSDWNTSGNWSPNVVPTANNAVSIPNVANNPVIGTGVTAVAKNIDLSDTLTVNNGGTLTISNIVTSGVGIRLRDNGRLTNNGSISITSSNTTTYGIEYNGSGTQTITNSGNITLNTTGHNLTINGNNSSFVNTVNGVINFQGATGCYFHIASASGSANNQGIINYSGFGLVFYGRTSTTFSNAGTINTTSGSGIWTNGSTFNNQACGRILMSAGSFDNTTAGSVTNNAGLISISNSLINTGGTFTNTGVLKYGTLMGTITSNQASSITVSNTQPIFTYGGTYNGTINGIFRDSLATVSAGVFTAPNDFRPLQTIPTGSQTLYVKITPSGGACSYVVPFNYVYTPRVGTKEFDNGTALHQNRPNPFSQSTIVSFDLTETNKAVLTVFDVNGRQVFTSNKDFKIGYNELTLDKSIFQTSGTYFYRLTTDKAATVKRLQFIGE